ncbi:hypothetical protein R1flu_006388 [Riccia fluitans]|uniref:Secreted protein n=1 Tax=Riccia fluitans TaxID=41844 RepID=A0ABD1YVV4_9MARC
MELIWESVGLLSSSSLRNVPSAGIAAGAAWFAIAVAAAVNSASLGSSGLTSVPETTSHRRSTPSLFRIKNVQ